MDMRIDQEKVNAAIVQYLNDFGVTNKTIWEVREASEACNPIMAIDGFREERDMPHCPDCGEVGERKGHQDCQYPQD